MEITLWHEEAGGILDSNMIFTIGKPGAAYSPANFKAQIKRGRDVEAYWSEGGKPVLSARDFNGWLDSENATQSFIFCGLPKEICRRELPLASGGTLVDLGTFYTGESEPF